MVNEKLEKLEEKIRNCILQMDDQELIELNNNYCALVDSGEDQIFDTISLIDDLYENSQDAWAFMMYLNEYNGGSSIRDIEDTDYYCYAKLNVYAKVVVFHDVKEEIEKTTLEQIVNYIVEENDALENDNIQEILDKN